LEDIERLDQLIGCFFSIAVESKEDFNRAIKAAHLTLELLDIKSQLLLNVSRDLNEFSFYFPRAN
jgi:hypothetical protein